MDNSERFMQAFRSIEGYLRKINEDYRVDGFARSLRDASKSDKTLRNYLDILLEYAELRNAIVHTLTRANQLQNRIRKSSKTSNTLPKC